MTIELLQDGAVTLVAMGAAAFLFRRVIVLMLPSSTQTGCSSCPSRQNACAPAGEQALPVVHPVRLHVPRPSSSSSGRSAGSAGRAVPSKG